MTQKATRLTTREKRVRHASAQASYMERKRAEGKEWLATWVPGPAKDSLKNLSQKANDDERQLDQDYITSVEESVGSKVPKWAQKSQTLLNIWLISENDVLVNFGHADNEDDKDKKDKSKKKKKKK